MGGNQLIFSCFALSLSRYSEDLEFDEAAACVFAKVGLKSAAKGKFQTASNTHTHTALPTDILMPAISASKGVSLSAGDEEKQTF